MAIKTGQLWQHNPRESDGRWYCRIGPNGQVLDRLAFVKTGDFIMVLDDHPESDYSHVKALHLSSREYIQILGVYFKRGNYKAFHEGSCRCKKCQ